jgi:hypothetical protein
MQIHYFILYDTATKQWIIDNATIHALLTEGPIYDVEKEQWRDPANEAEIELDKRLLRELEKKLDT